MSDKKEPVIRGQMTPPSPVAALGVIIAISFVMIVLGGITMDALVVIGLIMAAFGTGGAVSLYLYHRMVRKGELA